MLDNDLLHLVFLHSAWLTHNDLKSLFSTQDIFDPVGLWDSLISWQTDIAISEDRKQKILEKSKKIETEKIRMLLETKDIQIITWFDLSYPERLKTISHAPFFLYVRGHLCTDRPLIGIVGSRKSTPYAEKILEKIIPDTILAGVWIVSGGATGVDSIAHHITLKHDGYTIAVFGTGMDRCYPAGNKSLFEKIIEKGGAVISHFPLGTWPEVYNFPIRNEIVAAISNGTLIPEAALSSGTLITAQLALEHGRDVFAVPWDIDRVTSEGTNMLIATGQAKCVRCSWDILEEYFDIASIGAGMTPIVKIPPTFENDIEKILYEAIENGKNSVDTLMYMTELSMTDILTNLAMMEIRGHITLDQMGKYMSK